jgi:spoIIIJ-associated protein
MSETGTSHAEGTENEDTEDESQNEITQDEITQDEGSEKENTENEGTQDAATGSGDLDVVATDLEDATDPAATTTTVEPVDDDDHVAEGQDESAESAEASTSLHDRLEHEGDVAADYLEELLDIADLDGDLDMDVEGDRAAVSIVGADLSDLVGERGEVLDALQELTRLAVYRETGERSRLMLDISGHRAELRRQLEALATATAAQVKETGEKVSLRAMSPFERKVVHDAVAAAGLVSESEGVEPRRYVVVLPG